MNPLSVVERARRQGQVEAAEKQVRERKIYDEHRRCVAYLVRGESKHLASPSGSNQHVIVPKFPVPNSLLARHNRADI